MPERDPTTRPAGLDVEGSRERYKIHDLAKMLDTSTEKVRGWLHSGGIHPVADDAPDDYGVDAYEFVQTRTRGI